MIPALLARIATPLIVAAALVAAAGFSCWLTLRVIDGMIDDARASAIAERDAHWTAQIQKSNAEVQTRIAENLRQTMAVQNAARDEVAAAEARATQLETENAALPNAGACGLGRDRVRLLNKR
ncbi:hypothetical protein SAMN05880590_102756 [Rhizobium sp. RU35A]|uniref:hypothetical protein n=1 Tax=Rhizobium sp. RU35A TaxID=1907414 RepID=UPI000955B111|nr:hypothetical protein [Rhizobium sp. RU35A]SIQ24234.1 hypothetical protein SAMN05880590_102756 [Rhizobium sp. RU35A]